MDVQILALAMGYGVIGGVIRTVRDTYSVWKRYDLVKLDIPDAFFDLFFGGTVGGLVWLIVGDTTSIDNSMTILGLIGLGGFGADLIDPLMDKAKSIFGNLFPAMSSKR